MMILAIETSCDETATAVYDAKRGLLAHAIYSQIPLHTQYGGVVPELASRDHVKKTLVLIETVLAQAKISRQALTAIAYTAGPGLAGALLVGASIAQSMAMALNIPALAVHHLEGHLLAPFLEAEKPSFPFVALLVSGGHTMLMDVAQAGHYQLLGETLDDAAGEAFDKTAKLMGLPYPGGPQLAALAEKGRANIFKFPRPLIDRPDLNFSFSGLKTHVLQTWQQSDKSEQTKADISRAFQEAVIDVLIHKSIKAIEKTGYRQLVISGGVSANHYLREQAKTYCERLGLRVFYPAKVFCTDNAAMIAYAGFLRLQRGEKTERVIEVNPRWKL